MRFAPRRAKHLRMKVHVHVMLKTGVLDPQGKAVERALHGLGFPAVAEVRQGKRFEIELSETDPAAARRAAAAMCERLLANPVIEDYEIDVDA